MAELAWQSLPGHAWDTKQNLSYKSTFIINGKAEQRDYVGNAIWAAGVKSLGVSQETALWGARVQGSLSGVGREGCPRSGGNSIRIWLARIYAHYIYFANLVVVFRFFVHGYVCAWSLWWVPALPK
jgi:hypothetical protein